MQLLAAANVTGVNLSGNSLSGFNLNGIKRLLDDTHGTAERLRPIAFEALLSIFQQRLGTQIEEAFGEITRRLSQRRRKA